MEPSSAVRQPAVAGIFYPAQPQQLREEVGRFLADSPSTGGKFPKALIVPHAGYLYSGSTAACAFRLLVPHPERYRRVLIVGPAHRVPFRGLALPGAAAFRTPLGDVRVDPDAVAAAAAHPFVGEHPAAHASEHSIEVELPFLQHILPSFTILPLVVGWSSAEEVAALLDTLWGGEETLILISSDLSHYHPERTAHQIDRATIDRILAMDPTLTSEEACGATAISGFLLEARRRSLTPQLLAYATSADAGGPPDRVVGYTAIAWFEPSSPLPH
ncbi:MAG: AmmeMemoRadiSam system protein B [Hydrogenophilus sp.]|nr:AmmeMemoRadiSam system protein B [Hydrogenophilus sp.]